MKYALITGASKGIGKAFAECLAAQQHALLLVARSESLLQQLALSLSEQYKVTVHYLAIDLSANDAPLTIYNWCQQNNYQVNILINNAGYGLSGATEKYTLQQHMENMQVNMQAPTQLTYLFLSMLKKNRSYILNVCSTASYQAVPGLTIYAATKAYLLRFSRALGYELKNTSVTVTAVCPGATDTDFAGRANVTGKRAQKLAARLNMRPESVAAIALKGMFAGKKEIVPGWVNRVGKFFVWLLPESVSEKSAAKIYDL
ncbi:MAG: SDR family oxidoreductase [Sphingobacteriia bacterium]|nr:SDR family oxidoreductase [Sphingobacteriia bacterium]